MCDTQVLRADNGVWFAKNSDREPHEPQAVVAVPAVRADPAAAVRLTHITIPQVPDRPALVLCKPCWMWGAEMGFNSHGLVIGNEAIFSRERTLRPALLGMDLVRLALERARSSREGVEVITALLQTYGQGGPAGYADQRFHYDSSFILADRTEAWVLETAGREWVARRVEQIAAISNGLTIGADAELRSPSASGDFRTHDTQLMPRLACSAARRATSLRSLAVTARGPADFAALCWHLRQHAHAHAEPLAGSNRDLCMHAAGPIRRSQTTGSLIVWLGAHGLRALATGTSAPCLSLFRPLTLDADLSLLAPSPERAPLWARWESVQRAALFDARYRLRVQARIAAAEAELLPAWMQPDADVQALDALARQTADEILSWARPAQPWPLTPARWLWTRPVQAA